MAIYLPQEIANLVSQNLNDLAQDLYEASTISTKFIFYGTADFDIYERFIKGEYEIDDDQKITPFILTSINGAQEPEDYIRYEEQFQIKFYGFVSEKTDFEKVIREYINKENTTDRVIALDSFRVEKSTGFLTIRNEILPAMDGTLETRFEATFDFIWNFANGIMTSEDIHIYIDSVEIPYNMLSFTPEKRNVNTQAMTTSGIDLYMAAVQGYNLILNLPYLSSNAKLVSLFQDVWSKKYNRKYTLNITIGTDINFTEDVFISNGSFVDPKPTILDFEVVFKRVPKQTEIYINDVLIPVLEFNLSNKAETNVTNKLNEESIKSVYLASNYTITMTVPLDESDSNTTIAEIFARVLDGTYGVNYDIKLKRNSIEKTYNTLLVDGSYGFDLDSNGSIELVFTEVDGE